MAWPTTGASATGYAAQGVTTIRWGSKELVTIINGTPVNGTTIGIVTRFNQKPLVDTIKLPNGDGVTVTRVQVIDGMHWDVTVRDDMTITGRPKVGTTVVVVDAGGLVPGGSIGSKYAATVIEPSYDTAPKQLGEFTLALEALVLIEGYTPV